ncbi:MAG: peptide deformylase [Clostridia bacterium]|nr:peptide deformylase [Clostridia bacterium]
MAIRNIRKLGDEVLRKKCRSVDVIDERIITLLDDMADTLYDANGVGLAAPQVGVLKRIAVVDIGDGIIELINPEIVSCDGEQTDNEGCLSVPGKYGKVTRPNKVTVRAVDRNGDECEYTGEGLLARAFCHEIDHLSGIVFVDKVTEYLEDDE